jgi:hypothetical protein
MRQDIGDGKNRDEKRRKDKEGRTREKDRGETTSKDKIRQTLTLTPRRNRHPKP